MDITIASINKHKNVVLNAAIILAAFIIAFNIYSKMGVKLRSLEEKKEAEIKKSAVIENISRLEKKLAGFKGFLKKKDPDVIIDDISGIAKAMDIKIGSIKPLRERLEGRYVKIPFELALTVPGFHALGEFIGKIESQHDVYIVESVNITPNIEKNELVVDLLIYLIALAG